MTIPIKKLSLFIPNLLKTIRPSVASRVKLCSSLRLSLIGRFKAPSSSSRPFSRPTKLGREGYLRERDSLLISPTPSTSSRAMLGRVKGITQTTHIIRDTLISTRILKPIKVSRLGVIAQKQICDLTQPANTLPGLVSKASTRRRNRPTNREQKGQKSRIGRNRTQISRIQTIAKIAGTSSPHLNLKDSSARRSAGSTW